MVFYRGLTINKNINEEEIALDLAWDGVFVYTNVIQSRNFAIIKKICIVGVGYTNEDRYYWWRLYRFVNGCLFK